MSERPYRIRNKETGKTWSFASSDNALSRVAMLAGLPERYRDRFEFRDTDGEWYPVAPMLKTMALIARIYDIGRELVTSRG